MRRFLSTIMAMVLCLVVCAACHCDVPANPVSISQAPDTTFCSPAAENLNRLGNCGDRQATKGKFKDFCEYTQNNGVFLNPKCIASATSCDEVKKCEVR
jgi:hypothetical protein